jgi:hypothetical protein
MSWTTSLTSTACLRRRPRSLRRRCGRRTRTGERGRVREYDCVRKYYHTVPKPVVTFTMLLLVALRWSPSWGLGTVKIMLDVKFSSNTSFFTSPFPQQDKWSTFKNMLVLYHEDAQLYWQILSTAPTHQFQSGFLVLSFPLKTRYFKISNPVQASLCGRN